MQRAVEKSTKMSMVTTHLGVRCCNWADQMIFLLIGYRLRGLYLTPWLCPSCRKRDRLQVIFPASPEHDARTVRVQADRSYERSSAPSSDRRGRRHYPRPPQNPFGSFPEKYRNHFSPSSILQAQGSVLSLSSYQETCTGTERRGAKNVWAHASMAEMKCNDDSLQSGFRRIFAFELLILISIKTFDEKIHPKKKQFSCAILTLYTLSFKLWILINIQRPWGELFALEGWEGLLFSLPSLV